MSLFQLTFHQNAGLYRSDAFAGARPPQMTGLWGYTNNSFELRESTQADYDYKATNAIVSDERTIKIYGSTTRGIAYASCRALDYSTLYNQIAARFSVYATAGWTNAGTMLVLDAYGTAVGDEQGWLGVLQINTTTEKIRCLIYSLKTGTATLKATSAEVDTGGARIYQALMTRGSGGMENGSVNLKFWANAAAEPTAFNLTLNGPHVNFPSGNEYGVGTCNIGAATTPDLTELAWVSMDTFGGTIYKPKPIWERRLYLEDSSKVATILFEAGVLDATGVTAYAPLSNTGFITEPADYPSNHTYEGVVKSVGSFTQRMNEQLQGRSTQGFGDVVVSNADNRLDNWLYYNWDGRPFKILIGSPAWNKCDFLLGARGTIERVEQSGKDLVFKLRDATNVLARRVQANLIGGITVNAGKPKPLAFGTVFNVEPVLITAATHEYQVHDGPVTSIVVREGGNTIAHVADYSNGKFTLAANPAYELRCDVVNSVVPVLYSGAVGGNFSFGVSGLSHKAMFYTLAYLHSDLTLDQINYGGNDLAASESGTDAQCGLFVKPEHVNADDLLDQVVLSNVGFYYWNRWGELCAAKFNLQGAFGGGSPNGETHTILEDDVIERKLTLQRLIIPTEINRQIYYRKNWDKQNISALVGSVSESNKVLYSSEGTLYTSAYSFGGLDRPANHLLAKQKDPLRTLYETSGIYPADLETNNWVYQVGIFQFKTRRDAMRMEIGSVIALTHSQFEFDAGKRGVIVGLSKDFKTRVATVDIAVVMIGKHPTVFFAQTPFILGTHFG